MLVCQRVSTSTRVAFPHVFLPPRGGVCQKVTKYRCVAVLMARLALNVQKEAYD